MSEQYKLEVGDCFEASKLSTMGGTFRVIERYQQNGFCYYRAVATGQKKPIENGVTFRNKDVEKKIESKLSDWIFARLEKSLEADRDIYQKLNELAISERGKGN